MTRKLLLAAAAASVLMPAAAKAHPNDRVCLDQVCQTWSILEIEADAGFQAGGSGSGLINGTESPSFGTWGFDLAGMDRSVEPGDDFYRYANGIFQDNLVIPPDRTRYGAFDLLRELSENRLEALIDRFVADTSLDPASDEGKIANLYRSYMDVETIEALDARPLEASLSEIRGLQDHSDIAAFMGSTQFGYGRALFGAAVFDDAKNPDVYAAYLFQGGIGLPDRDYYLAERFTTQKAAYVAYVAEMLGMIGWENPQATAEQIVAFEQAIAEVHWTRIQSRDDDLTYNPMTPAELAEAAPGFDWSAFFQAAGMGEVDRFIVAQNTAVPAMARIYAETPVEVLRAWSAFHLADQAAPLLSQRFVDANWRFRSNVLAGQPEQRPRERRAILFTEGRMGEALGRFYVAEYFPPEYRAQMEELVGNLRRAMAIRIQGLSWMSDETKARALEKLEKFGVKIGYPDEWRDFSGLEVRVDDLYGNAERAVRFEWERDLSRIGQPVDEDEWGMTPQTVNAYYSSTRNEIVFPAAILQPPFFDPDADPAVNYGGIGGVIGHEIGHGFDDQGRKSDGDGVLREWWTPEDEARFEAQAARLGNQYDQFEPLPGFNVQGALTMGENIGDLAGVILALTAYDLSLNGAEAPVLDGITGHQRVFFGWAQVWRGKYRDEAMQNQVATGPHSPPEFRVVGPVRNIDAWYEAFGVEPGDALYLPPEERVRIW